MKPPLAFSVVTKPTGAVCNLECRYCFFLSKGMLYAHQSQMMQNKVLEKYISEFLAESPDGNVTMLWQGGEPMMRGLDYFKTAMELVEKYRRPHQQIQHNLQTNGTLINKDWADFFYENKFLIGVSFDGTEKLHDTYRLNRGGRGSYKMVRKGWDILQEHQVECNVLCTVHEANQNYPEEIYYHFRDELQTHYMQFIPIVERYEKTEPVHHKNIKVYTQTGRSVSNRSVQAKKYGKFLIKIYDQWRKKDIGEIFIQDIDSALSALFNQATTCVHAKSCGNNFAMEFNGDVYTCDHWVEPEWKLGSIKDKSFSEMAASPLMLKFAEKKKHLSQRCHNCPYLKLCGGGCPKDRFIPATTKDEEENYLCPGYYAFYQHIYPDLCIMARLITQGKPASELMEIHQTGRK